MRGDELDRYGAYGRAYEVDLPRGGAGAGELERATEIAEAIDPALLWDPGDLGMDEAPPAPRLPPALPILDGRWW